MILPAVLAILGHRVDTLSLGSYRGLVGGSGRRWAATARVVMRRPAIVSVGTAAILLLLGAPFLGVVWGGIDARVLPAMNEAREATETLQEDFPAATGSQLDLIVRDLEPGPETDGYVEDVGSVDGVSRAAVQDVSDDGTILVAAAYDGDQITRGSTELVERVREVDTPSGAAVLVGGSAAEHVDTVDSIGQRAPWAAGTAILATMLLLFLAFGSVVLPVKAVVVNLLSLCAVLGVLVWGFQDGNLAALLGFTPTETLEITQPLLVLAIAFGLSTDYEVFLLSRVREEWLSHGDNARAVENGLAKTGGIITSAALLLGIVMTGFLFSRISFIQTIGVGLLVGLLLDALVVRVLLVPSTMRLLGRANWWAPAPLARWWERHGVPENHGGAGAGAAASGPSPPAHKGAPTGPKTGHLRRTEGSAKHRDPT